MQGVASLMPATAPPPSIALLALPLPLLHALVPFLGPRDAALARTAHAVRRRLCAEDPAAWRVALEVAALRGFTPARAEAFLRREGWDVDRLDGWDALTRERDGWGVCALVAAILRRRAREVAALAVLYRARLGERFFTRGRDEELDYSAASDELEGGALDGPCIFSESGAPAAVLAAVHTGQALELAPILLAVGCDARVPRIGSGLPWDAALVDVAAEPAIVVDYGTSYAELTTAERVLYKSRSRTAAQELAKMGLSPRNDERFQQLRQLAKRWLDRKLSLDARAGAHGADRRRADRGFVLSVAVWEAATCEAKLARGAALRDASERLRADKALMLDCVRAAPLNLRHASDGLRADRGLVLEAVGRDPAALQHASDTLRGDHSLVRARARALALRSPRFGFERRGSSQVLEMVSTYTADRVFSMPVIEHVTDELKRDAAFKRALRPIVVNAARRCWASFPGGIQNRVLDSAGSTRASVGSMTDYDRWAREFEGTRARRRGCQPRAVYSRAPVAGRSRTRSLAQVTATATAPRRNAPCSPSTRTTTTTTTRARATA